MLKDVRESEETVFFGDDISHILHSRTVLLTSEDLWEPFVVVLLIDDIASSVVCSLLTERETTFSYVGIFVIVKRSGADVLILL